MTHRGLARFTSPRTGRLTGRGPAVRQVSPPEDTPTPERIGAPDGAVDADVAMAPALTQVLGARERPTSGDVCEMCAVPVDEDHRHAVDLERRSLLCVCRGCALLFEHSARGGAAATGGAADARTATDGSDDAPSTPIGRYRTVPERYLRIEPFALPAQAWAALQIPVGVAFVVANTSLGRPVAFYPSPGGATEADVPPDAWTTVVDANPGLADVEPDVEAALIRTDTTDGRASCHIVPVDRCYELVGVLRLHWRGFDGGAEVRDHIAAFFSDVDRRAGRASSTDPNTPHDRGDVARTSEVEG